MYWLIQNDVCGVIFFGQDWGGFIGLCFVVENLECFDWVVVVNIGLLMLFEMLEEKVWEVKQFFLLEMLILLMEEMMVVVQLIDFDVCECKFVYWQKWIWEIEDVFVGMVFVGSVMVGGGLLMFVEFVVYEVLFFDVFFKMVVCVMLCQVLMLFDDLSFERQVVVWKVFSEFDKLFLCVFIDDDFVMCGVDVFFCECVFGVKG